MNKKDFWRHQQLSRKMKTHCCPENDETIRFPVFLLEAEHLFERKSRADVGIQNEKSLWTARDNLISEVIDASTGAQSRVLLKVPAFRGETEKNCCRHSSEPEHFDAERRPCAY